MSRKKVFTLASSLLVLGGALTGCGSSTTPANNTTVGSNSPAPVTITFWNAYSATDPEVSVLKKDIIPAFEKQYPYITVKDVEFPYDQMQKKLLTSAAGADLPDAARIDIIWTSQLAKLGILVQQDQLAGFSALQSQVFKGPLSTATYNGHYFALPLDTNTKILFYNQALFAKAGISGPPTSMTDMVQDIAKLSSGSGKSAVYGYALGGFDLWNAIPWINSAGGSLLSPDMTKASGYLNSPETIAAVQQLATMASQHQISGFNNGDMSTSDGFAKGKYAMIDDGPWMDPIFAGQYPNFKYSKALWPAGTAGSVQVVGGENIAIFNTDQAHQDAAWKFEQFMLSPATQIAMAKVGQMPVLNNISNDPQIQQLGNMSLFLEQLKTSASRPSIPQYGQVDQIIMNAITQAVQGKVSVKTALDGAAQQVDQVLASQS